MSGTRLLLLAAAALAALGLGLGLIFGSTGGGSSRGPSSSPSSTAAGGGPQGGFDGAALPSGIVAPGFALTDQNGRRVALGDYRGRVVVLAFLSPTAGGASALIAQQIRGALDDLSRPIAVLVVSAAPPGVSSARVRRFLASASLTGRIEYLSGTASQLRGIWRAYRIVPISAGRARFERSATVLLIDPRGRQRVVFGIEQLTPEGLAHDVRALQSGE